MFKWSEYLERPPRDARNARVVRMLKRFHPRVRLVWNRSNQKWQMVENGRDGRWWHVASIDGVPTMDNTVNALNAMDMRRHQTKADFDRFVSEVLVEREDKPSTQHVDQVQEGHKALWNVLTERKVFAKP